MSSIPPQFGLSPLSQGNSADASLSAEKPAEQKAAQRRWDRQDNQFNVNGMFRELDPTSSGAGPQLGSLSSMLSGIDAANAFPQQISDGKEEGSGIDGSQETLFLMDLPEGSDISPEASSALSRYGNPNDSANDPRGKVILASVIIANAHHNASPTLNYLA